MNIFKVLSSGRRPFSEEQASALLAWLLHPHMEHGLAFHFLARFLEKIADGRMDEAIGFLRSRLRDESQHALEFNCSLEEYCPGTFIDVVLQLGDWIIVIENKIRVTSVTPGQLNREYMGIKAKYSESGKKICFIYLVPLDTGPAENLHSAILDEYNSLNMSMQEDFCSLVTWQLHDQHPSIEGIIAEMLEKEATGEIEPVSEYMRHTLKALRSFIASSFEGYWYQGDKSNRSNFTRFTVCEIERKPEGYVGVKGGLSGLLKYSEAELKGATFQFTNEGKEDTPQWLPRHQFLEVANWLLGKGLPCKSLWKEGAVLSSRLLLKIASAYPKDSVFIGVRGGISRLQGMEPAAIENARWQIKSEKPGRNPSEWIEGDCFVSIVVAKGIVKKK